MNKALDPGLLTRLDQVSNAGHMHRSQIIRAGILKRAGGIDDNIESGKLGLERGPALFERLDAEVPTAPAEG